MDTPLSREATSNEEQIRDNEEQIRDNEEQIRGNEEHSRDNEEHSREAQMQLEPGQLEPGQLEPGQLELGQSEPGQSEPGQSEPGQLEPGQSESGQSEPGQLEPGFGAVSPNTQHDIQLSSPSSEPDNEAEENLIHPIVPRTLAPEIPEPTLRKVKPMTPLKYHKKKVSLDKHGVARCNALSRDNPFLSLYYQNIANPRTNFPDLPIYADGRAVVSTRDAELLDNIFYRNKRK